jgi:hypothetical protein
MLVVLGCLLGCTATLVLLLLGSCFSSLMLPQALLLCGCRSCCSLGRSLSSPLRLRLSSLLLQQPLLLLLCRCRVALCLCRLLKRAVCLRSRRRLLLLLLLLLLVVVACVAVRHALLLLLLVVLLMPVLHLVGVLLKATLRLLALSLPLLPVLLVGLGVDDAGCRSRLLPLLGVLAASWVVGALPRVPVVPNALKRATRRFAVIVLLIRLTRIARAAGVASTSASRS